MNDRHKTELRDESRRELSWITGACCWIVPPSCAIRRGEVEVTGWVRCGWVKWITRRRDKEDTMVRDELIERLVELRGWRRGLRLAGCSRNSDTVQSASTPANTICHLCLASR
jgi:hypothetical protein